MIPQLQTEINAILKKGVVIPAHPLALTAQRTLDERRQRALTSYYIDAGVGGLAVGVHTTQFAIHDPKIGLYEPVLALAMETMTHRENMRGKSLVKIAGVIGETAQAVREAGFAREIGYHAALLNVSALRESSIDELISHCSEVSKIIPLFGFYLNPQIGGRVLDYDFWRRFVEIENVVAIKVAPFNRYQSIDVIRAVADAGRENDIALYTGNDDAIIHDLITPFEFHGKKLRIVGGLLGHWAVWTKRAVEQLEEIHSIMQSESSVPHEMMKRATEVTDANGAFFDARNNFAGCIPGILEVLRRQGIIEGIWCVDANETLSAGQMQEIDRVYRAYPHLNDDEFVKERINEWLK